MADPTTHVEVIAAVVAFVKAACPFADVKLEGEKPRSPGPGGTIIIREGDAGDPEIDLSPPRYNYQRRMPIEIYAADIDVVRDLLGAIADGQDADRSLGGLCDWFDAEAPDREDLDAPGAATTPWVEAALLPSYVTANPLK